MKEGENVIKFVASQVFRQRMFFINIEEKRIRLHIFVSSGFHFRMSIFYSTANIYDKTI